MHYYIKGNKTQYSILKIFCFLKGKKTNANNNNKILKTTFAAETKHALLFIYFPFFKRK